MPRARCPESVEAEKRYKAGEKLVDIARSLKVPEGTVRRWKSTQEWDAKTSKKQNERSVSNANGKTNVRKQETARIPEPPTLDQQLSRAVDENKELTEKQKDFCLYFSRIKNATQAYYKAFGGAYSTANVNGPKMLVKASIKAELAHLRDIKAAALGGICGDDIVEMHMRIAFADITDYVAFRSKRVPVLHNGASVTMKDPKTGEDVPVTKSVNVVELFESARVDGQIIAEVSEGREGVKLKLADRHKSLAFLERYFELNPMDAHRKEYDKKRYELDLVKAEAAAQMPQDGDQGSSSNFLEAMMGVADDVWNDTDNSDKDETDDDN